MKVIIKAMMLGWAFVLTTVLTAQEKLSPDAFEKKLNELGKSVQLIDVRTPEEFALDHLAGARNVNFRDLDFREQLQALDKSKPILLYCAAGGRSLRTIEMLTQYGFSSIYELEGGIIAWIEKDKPLANPH